MASESTQLPDGYSGAIKPDWLADGNARSSRTPDALIPDVISTWTIAAHCTNTPTGFSATLFKNKSDQFVLSIRSTEFIDDAVRDTKDADDQEIRAGGFALGQLADLENWYQTVLKPIVGGSSLTVTGYSLGGHLATAFEQLHRNERTVSEVYTFNGAGVGKVNVGHSLDEVLKRFSSHRSASADLSNMFTDPDVRAMYGRLRTRLIGGALVSDKDLSDVAKMTEVVTVADLVVKGPSADALMLQTALTRIRDLQAYAAYVSQIHDDHAVSPSKIATERPELVEATNLNYQLAFLDAASLTTSMPVALNIWYALQQYGPRDDPQPNIADVTAYSFGSGVSNSQFHHGSYTPVFIEDQPLYRGTAIGDAWKSLDWQSMNVKLLANNFSENDFGDTHSLALLQDSLSMQTLKTRLDSSLSLSADAVLLKAASNSHRAQSAGTQGKADGDTLEKAVDTLSNIFDGPTHKALSGYINSNDWLNGKSRNEGGTWSTIADRNQVLYTGMMALDTQTRGLAGKLQIQLPGLDAGAAARADFGVLVSVVAGSPWTVRGVNAEASRALEAALAQPWRPVYEAWKYDRSLTTSQRQAGLGNFSDRYLVDRAGYVRALVLRNTFDVAAGATVLDRLAAPTSFKDATSGTSILTRRDTGIPDALLNVAFGGSDGETLNGINVANHLYGANGNDTLTGGSKDDWLEGNADNDQLDGGQGDDMLLGGRGSDRYLFGGSFGNDTVVDSDGQGALVFNGEALGAARSAGANTWVAKTASGVLVQLELVKDTKSVTGQSLLVRALVGAGNNLIRVQNFDLQAAQGAGGYLGLKLEAQRALVISQTDQADPFAPEVAWDFDKDKVPTLQASAPERTGQNFSIHLNQAAQQGDTLQITVAGGGAPLTLMYGGQVLQISGSTTLNLAAGQTDLGFTLAGASDQDADKLFQITASWASVAVGLQGTDQVAQSNLLELTLKDSGATPDQYHGDWQAPVYNHMYDWSGTHWDTKTGQLVGGIRHDNFNDVITGSAAADLIDGGLGGNDALDGQDGNDHIDGGAGDDLIGGGRGSDYLVGGLGNDVILSAETLIAPRQTRDDKFWQPPDGEPVWARGDTWGVYQLAEDIYEVDGGGPIQPDSAPDIVQAGAGDDWVTGGGGDDMLDGEAGRDQLVGLGGDDALTGGEDDDFIMGDGIQPTGFYESSPADEHGQDDLDGGNGNDTMTGDGSDDLLQGGAGNDQLYGDRPLILPDEAPLAGEFHGADLLDGGEGDDQLCGDGGADSLLGGLGNDTLLGDVLTEDQTDGRYHGADSIDGGAGNDAIQGDGAADWLDGGDGDDVIYGDSSNTPAAFHGNDSLLGGNGSDQLSGDGGDDWLFGGEDAGNDQLWGDSDTLDGSLHGRDTLDGGAGDDVLHGDGAGDVLTGGEGKDRLYGDSRNLAGAFHGADALDGGAGDDWAEGGGANDTVTGGEGNDQLNGDASTLEAASHGDDVLDGGAGDDTLQGQGGNDTLFGGEGNDKLAGGDEFDGGGKSSLRGNDLLLGGTGQDTLWGGLGDDDLGGGDGNDLLLGGEGDDALEGGAGSDTLAGGAGDDSYYVDGASLAPGVLEVIDDQEGANTLYLQGTVSAVEQSAGDLSLSFGDGQQLLVKGGLKGGITQLVIVGEPGDDADQGVAPGANDATGFTEWLQLNYWQATALTAENNSSALYSGAGNDTLTAATGAITLNGGWGDDLYVVRANNQVVVEYDHGGIDTVQSEVSFTLGAAVENLRLTGTARQGTGNDLDNLLVGNASDNTLVGGRGNDTLDGGAGVNRLEGGEGDDTYVVPIPFIAKISEAADAGTDTLLSGIGASLQDFANVENLTLTTEISATLEGNRLHNQITGNTRNDTLLGGPGNDTLNGGGGLDLMRGGEDDDTYVLDSLADQVNEAADEGLDTVQFAGALDLKSFKNVENATLLGDGNDALTGDAQSNLLIGNQGNNLINGADGQDTLFGGGGDDTLQGGAGDDVYLVDSLSDLVREGANAGNDTVQSVVSWALGSTTENLVLLGGASLDATGNAGANALSGNDGDNLLDGMGGMDSMAGGLGDDTYRLDSLSDLVTEAADAGIDTIEFAGSLDLTSYANIDNLRLQGAGNDTATGNALNNLLVGNSGNNNLVGAEGDDTLEGGAGADTLAGGRGNDTYVVETSNDALTEQADEGTDTVQSAINFTLSAALGEVENLSLTGDTAQNATGNKLNNLLQGNALANRIQGVAGNDTLDGGQGADSLEGGAGDDTYIVDELGDLVIEGLGQGADSVLSSVRIAGLASNVENLTLVGNANLDATGNDLNNLLQGNTGDNTLDGGQGDDTLRGGAGNDLYVLDALHDVAQEAAGEGVDTVHVTGNWTLGDNFENAVLTAAGAFSLTGNALDNLLQGNVQNNQLQGGDGNDTLDDGGGGADTLVGDAGDDIYVLSSALSVAQEAAEGGHDLVRMGFTGSLSANLEDLTLTGSEALSGTGNALDNNLTGNDAANVLKGLAGKDTLFGAGGEDRLMGGRDDDVYLVNSGGDRVVELDGEGQDEVQSSVSFRLGDAIESLVLTGDDATNGTGNRLANQLTGNSAANRLDGGAGDDTLAGGAGDDIYVRDTAGDQLIEALGAGLDTEVSTVSTSLIGLEGIENLELAGVAQEGEGNDGDNLLTGNASANTLRGGKGKDTLIGGAGSDVLIGGDGDDVYVLNAQAGNGWHSLFAGAWQAFKETDVEPGSDEVDGVVAAEAQDKVQEALGGGVDTVQAGISAALADNVENLTLTGSLNLTGRGNRLGNLLQGNAGNNRLQGLAGDDTLDGGGGRRDLLEGGTGNDTYVLRSTNDAVVETVDAGIDTVKAGFTVNRLAENVENLVLLADGNLDGTGNDLANDLAGNGGNNRLDGGTGADRMHGGQGDDTYVLDQAGDQVIEADQEGTDTVEVAFSVDLGLPGYAHIENLSLTGTGDLQGTGSSANNLITGNAGNNLLRGGAGTDTLLGGAGNDTLDGGDAWDSDTLKGGTGDDTYVLTGTANTIQERANEGNDTVLSANSVELTGALQNIENLTLTGTRAINATGNQAANVLTGNGADNVLDGAGGTDRLVGGLGDDTYVLSEAGDQPVERAGEGVDTVRAAFSLDLSNAALANIENATLTGASDAALTGSATDNRLIGNLGANRILGGAGSDTLSGGDGNDELTDDLGGQDVLVGDAGADVFRIGAASAPGTTRYVKVQGGSDGDVLYLGNGILPEHVIRKRAGDNFVLEIHSPNLDLAAFSVELTNQLRAGGKGQVQELRFVSAPDVVWTLVDLGGVDSQVGTDGDDALVGTDGRSDWLQGLGGNDTLRGLGSADTLAGGTGNDRLFGGTGDDIYEFGAQAGNDLVDESASDGQDTVRFIDGIGSTHVQLFRVAGDMGGGGYTNDSLVIRNTDTGDETWIRQYFQADGTALVERLSFADGSIWQLADVLARTGGTTSIDAMVGTTGDDRFTVDNYRDTVQDSSDTDHDVVSASVSWTLSAHLESLELAGQLGLSATGNDTANSLLGNAGDNHLNGGLGIDTLYGGAGDDTYLDRWNGTYGSASVDTVTELAGQGHDTLVTNHPLRDLEDNVEDLLVQSDAYAITWPYEQERGYRGNALDNRIQVDVADGVGSWIDGGLGADTMIGSKGRQTFIVDNALDQVIDVTAGDGDTVRASISYALGANLDNLVLTGSSPSSGKGNGTDNVLDGTRNVAANALYGLGGDDIYRLGFGDTANESAGGGIDTVVIADAATMHNGELRLSDYANVERLSADFSADVHVRMVGDDSSNELRRTGATGDALLEGLAGDDWLDECSPISASRQDTLLGGAGSDILVSDGGLDWLDGGAGNDHYELGYQVIDADFYGLTLTSNGPSLRLGLGTGHDTAEYTGEWFWETEMSPAPWGPESSKEVRRSVHAQDAIAGHEMCVELDAGIDPTTLRIIANGSDLKVSVGAGDDITIADFFGSGEEDTVTSPINRVVFGGACLTADAMADSVGRTDFRTATSGDDVLIAPLGGGVTVSGGDGQDYLAGGLDAQRLSGDKGDDTLFGGDGADTLVGGAGNDTLSGGRGADTYEFSAGWGRDALNEARLLGWGADEQGLAVLDDPGLLNTVVFDSSVAPEDLSLTWNSQGLLVADVKTGDQLLAQGDVASLEDVEGQPDVSAMIDEIRFANGTVWDRRRMEWGIRLIEGTAGKDTLTDKEEDSRILGWAGDDTITVRYLKTQVSGGEGNDQITSTVAGTGGNTREVSLYGDAGSDTLSGGGANDLLDGGQGADRMAGGAGDDEYMIDSTTDQVIELAGQGWDQATSAVSITLADNVEQLSLAYSAGAINGTGNAGNNLLLGNEAANELVGGLGDDNLRGNGGEDRLDGGAGNDTLVGGAAADTYIFTGPSYGTDTINGPMFSPQDNDVDDSVNFGATKSTEVGFIKVGNDLEIRLTGSDSKLVITGWYLGEGYQVESFVFADVTLTSKSGRIPLTAPLSGADSQLDVASLITRWGHRRIGLPAHEASSLSWSSDQATAAARLVDAMSQFTGHAGDADDIRFPPHERLGAMHAQMVAPLAWT